MSRKDYVVIAAAFASRRDYVESHYVGTEKAIRLAERAAMIEELADYLAQNNDRFDRQSFYAACGK